MPKYECVFHDPKASQLYSRCRYVDEEVLLRTGQTVWDVFRLARETIGETTAALVEAGVGSGRLFLPLLRSRLPAFEHALAVGVDVAQPMLDKLSENLAAGGPFPPGPFLLQRWDIQAPYPPLGVPVAVIFSLATFHILQNWNDALSNAVNLLGRRGRLILIKEINQFMHQTEGFDGDGELVFVDPVLSSFMREYHRLRSALGFPFIPEGILYSDFGPALRELKAIGFDLLEIKQTPALSWRKPHSYSELLLTLKEKVITTWGTDLPDKERHAVADNLWNWLRAHRVNVDAIFDIPARFEIYVFGSSV